MDFTNTHHRTPRVEVEKPHEAAPALGARCWCCVGQGDSTLGCLGPCRMTNTFMLRDSLGPGVKLGSFAMKLFIVLGETEVRLVSPQ